MERMMSVEDKIRKAEEIYYRRREREMPTREKIMVSGGKKKELKLFRKMIKQIIVCITIYALFYVISNNNYVFSKDFTDRVNGILSKDINFKQLYSVILTKYNEIINTDESNYKQNVEQKINEEQLPEEEKQQNNEENIGGAEEILTQQNNNETKNESLTETEENIVGDVQLTQMEQDANYIKNAVSFIRPVTGTISSPFGQRNPTTATVPKNHTGTDIAAKSGTKIISATNGTVILSSTKGDYGKHLKIQIDDIIIVYAHCSKLYVKEGEYVTQGQEIAEVGATGNVTGPHLHFEVRYQNRYVDPQMILEL